MAVGSLLDHAPRGWNLALIPLGLLATALLSALPMRAAARIVSDSDWAD
jgi:hypothetical protein